MRAFQHEAPSRAACYGDRNRKDEGVYLTRRCACTQRMGEERAVPCRQDPIGQSSPQELREAAATHDHIGAERGT